jgi:TonB family protein
MIARLPAVLLLVAGVGIAAGAPKSWHTPCSGYPLRGATGPFRMGASNPEIRRPVCVSCPAPRIQGHLDLSELRGPLVLEAVISERGRVRSVKVLRPVHPRFDAAAVAALESARFRPATRNGRPVAVCMAFMVQAHP